MGIPLGFYQGNRSEYLAIPALSKLGFTIPVPRQEDHFGVDFIVHLATNVDNVVTPTGKAFGIQVKTDSEEAKTSLAFDTQDRRDSLYNSSLSFFLGVVSRQNLTLTIYNTLNRLNFFWMLGPKKDFSLVVDDTADGIPKLDMHSRTGGTGKPVLEIGISEPSTSTKRSVEAEVLQSTMRSWVDLETKNLSLKAQGIALLFWPSTYSKNKPLGNGVERHEPQTDAYTKFAGPDSLRNVCRATEEALTSLSFYLRRLQRDNIPPSIVSRMKEMHPRADLLRDDCKTLRNEWPTNTGPPAMPSPSRQ